jgi:predicted O-linked N-acetylglucosamine transferase (SPINDLY family)
MFKNPFKRNAPPPAVAPVAAPVPPAARVEAAAPVVPDDIAGADALIEQGNALEDGGDLAQAQALYRQAVAKAPGHARAHLNLGIALVALGDADGAAAAYERVLAIDPAHAFGNYNYARLMLLRGDTDRAEKLVAAALRTKPEFPQALMVQSAVFDNQGRREFAITSLQAALRLQPEDPGNWFNLGSLLRRQGRPDEAEVALRRSLEGDPDNGATLSALAIVLRDQGFANEALEALEKASALGGLSWNGRSFELLLTLYSDRLSAREIFERHARFGADLEQAFPARFQHAGGTIEPGRRLRVGYLSADLQLHPVSFFLLPALEHHDRARVEVFCYSFVRGGGDVMTRRLRAASEHWRDVAELTDAAIADAIHADGIDVLVDLCGHTGEPRLAVFAQRPAPVQVSWLGYLNTTGLTRIDHRLTDRRADPPEIAQSQHTERLHLLPNSLWAYRPMANEPLAPGAPFERNGHLTFGAFNAALKVTPAMCRRWGELLARVPESRLLVANSKSGRKREAILREIEAAGVARDRVEFMERIALEKYLALYNRVDIALDCYPYGGGTTSLDALWMGTPVVATLGPTSVSRSAASVLAVLGLDDWIAPTIADFVDTVVARAADRDALRALRRDLRARLQASPLMDVPRFVRDLEAAYFAMRNGDAG